MKRKWFWLMTVSAVITLFGSAAMASDAVRLLVDGKEVKTDVPAQVVKGRTMVPVRWVAQALGADVNWDAKGRTVEIRSSKAAVPREQVVRLIQQQGSEKADTYYFDGLSYQLVNIDGDDALEIVAKIDGAVHLGQFFIFDKQADGFYKLVLEKNWKVEQTGVEKPIDVQGKQLFETVTRTGGTGIDIFTAHLWYMENGQFVEAWNGNLKDLEVQGPGNSTMKLGNHQVTENGVLVDWQTLVQLDSETMDPKGQGETVTTLWKFDGKQFLQQK